MLKSALNKRENVGEKREIVGDDGEGRDGHDSLRDCCSGQKHSPFGTGADSNDSNTPVYSCVQAASRKTTGKTCDHNLGKGAMEAKERHMDGQKDGDVTRERGQCSPS